MTYLYASLKDFQATEQTFSAQNMKFIIFFNFCVIFALLDPEV